MRDSTIIEGFKSLEQRLGQVVQFVQNLQQAIRLDSTGKELRLISLQKLLIKKGIITETEMTEEVGETIKEMQKQAEEEAKKAVAPEIVVPTTEQVQKVAETKVAEPRQDGYTPNPGGISVEEHNKLNEQVQPVIVTANIPTTPEQVVQVEATKESALQKVNYPETSVNAAPPQV